jgi:adenosylcobyric acid synthase
MTFIAARTGWAPMGLVPFFDGARSLPAEDAADLGAFSVNRGGPLRIAVPVLPGIANFDDLDPLRAEPAVDLVMLHHGAPLPTDTDLVILVGSKTTIADLAALRAFGWDADIIAHHRRGGQVLGLCGGYQMLGKRISDPDGIEGPPASVQGLGLLDVETILQGPKQLSVVRGLTLTDSTRLHGYEMHMGLTKGADAERPMIRMDDGRADGARSPDGRVSGSYIHGFFISDEQRSAWLTRFGGVASTRDHAAETESALDALAAHVVRFCNVEAMMALAASARTSAA